MATYPIITDVTASQLSNLIATNALEEGLQYKDITNGILYLATSVSTVLKLNNWLNWVDRPDTPDSPGEENQVAHQANRFYYYDTDVSKWRMITNATANWAHCVELIFDDIVNADAIVGDSLLVADWNTAFNHPSEATPFSSVTVDGNTVYLYGGADVVVPDSLFSTDIDDYGHLISIIDTGCIVAAGYNSFGDFDIDSNGTILETIDLPACTTMAESCYGCTALTSISLPALTTAANSCFRACYALTSVSLPALTTAGDICFSSCTALTSISLPELTTAGGYCFYSCTALTSISLPELTTAANSCFRACTALTSVSLPALTTAGGYCFYSCTALTSISLPSLSAANTSLGGTNGDDNVFNNITGQTITLTVPVYFQTNDGGNPDGDIVYLATNNIETIIYV